MESLQAVSAIPEEPAAPPAGGDERALWPRVAAGDRLAAERLIEASYRRIYAALFKLCGGDADLAADLTQETYRKAWAAVDRFRGGCRFSTWVYQIAYRTFLNHLRRPRRLQPLSDQQLERRPDPEAGAEERLSGSQQAGRLRRAVLDLPEELRFAVTARFWAELPVREIARQQQVSAVAVRKRLRRAYALLGAALEESMDR